MKQPTFDSLFKSTERWVTLIGLMAVALLYLLTLDNGLRPDELTGGDLITHQYAQVEARPSNAPGYPLYTMGGWLWFRLSAMLGNSWLNPTQRLSLYSTMWGLASLMVLYLILRRLCHWTLAGWLTLFYASTYFFWYYSVTTEQYTSAVFQTLLMIWLAFRWNKTPRNDLLLWMAFLSGTMLANMLTTLFILPPLLWFIFWRPSSTGSAGIQPIFSHSAGVLTPSMLLIYLKQPKLIGQAIIVTALPLLSYAYIFIRGTQHPEWRGEGEWATAWDWFTDFITIQQGQDELGPGLSLEQFFTTEFPALMGQELTLIILIGGLLGIAFLGWRRAIFLYSTLSIYMLFCWAYRFGNWFQVIIPAYPIFLIGVAAGVAALNRWLSKNSISLLNFSTWKEIIISRFCTYSGINEKIRNDLSFLSPLYTIANLIMLILACYHLIANLPQANQRNQPTDTGLDLGWLILADQPPADITLLTDFEERVALQYLQTMWQLAPTMHLSEKGDTPLLPHYLTRRAHAANPTQLDLSRHHPHALGEQIIMLTDNPLTELLGKATPSPLPFGDLLTLQGYHISPANDYNPNTQITLYWQTDQSLSADYTISVRPMRDGQPISLNDTPLIQDHQPVWGLYPTSQWQPSELVADVYALPLPVRPDALQIVVYYALDDGFENLAVQMVEFQ
ncbi:DUF2723 domain-containing protein [Anaerolineales bacterium HSG24]|nr:DUF2723 domain-containing protein [Anaerolineales bacterium HSG24]